MSDLWTAAPLSGVVARSFTRLVPSGRQKQHHVNSIGREAGDENRSLYSTETDASENTPRKSVHGELQL